MLGHRDERQYRRLALAQALLIEVEHAPRRADGDRGGLREDEPADAALAVDRGLVHRAPRRGRRVELEDRVDRPALGDEDVLDHDALGAGAAQSEHVPVVDDLAVGVVDDADEVSGHLAGRRVVAEHEAEGQVGRRVAARDVVPGARDAVAALRRRGGGRARAEAARHADLAVGTVDVDLALLGPQRREHVGVAGGEGVGPAAGRTAARQRHGHAREGRQVELVAPEAPRLEDPVEARVDEVAAGLVGQAPDALALLLALAQHRDHVAGALDDLVLRQAGLGDRDRLHLGGRHRPPLPNRRLPDKAVAEHGARPMIRPSG